MEDLKHNLLGKKVQVLDVVRSIEIINNTRWGIVFLIQ